MTFLTGPQRSGIGTAQVREQSSTAFAIEPQCDDQPTMPRAAFHRPASAGYRQANPAPTLEASGTPPTSLRRTARVQAPRRTPTCPVSNQPPPRRGVRHDSMVGKGCDRVGALDEPQDHGDGGDEWEEAAEIELTRCHPDTGPLCGPDELHEQEDREPLIGPEVRGRHQES